MLLTKGVSRYVSGMDYGQGFCIYFYFSIRQNLFPSLLLPASPARHGASNIRSFIANQSIKRNQQVFDQSFFNDRRPRQKNPKSFCSNEKSRKGNQSLSGQTHFSSCLSVRCKAFNTFSQFILLFPISLFAFIILSA